jgi:hypothetical protein
MKLLYPLLLLGSIIFSGASYGQTLLNTTGNTLANGALTLEYSVGEIAINTLSGTTNDLTQGLLQPGLKVEAASGCPSLADINFYPNPTRNKARVVGNGGWITGYMIYAADGKLVAVSPYLHQNIDLTPYAAGVYFIKLLPECNGRYKTLKLLKQ